MANRHKSGGIGVAANPPVKRVSGMPNDPVIKEAHERKFGGAVAGAKVATRMDRPGRKRGGRVGADSAPLTSAASSKMPPLAPRKC